MKIASLITIFALTASVYATPLYVYQRDIRISRAEHPGLVTGTNNVPVQILIYGREDFNRAVLYGANVALHDRLHRLADSEDYIRSEAAKLYQGKEAFQQWFILDAKAGYNAEERKLTPR